jgi:hypothetical protein
VIYLAILLFALFFAVAIVAHFTASPAMSYRAAQDPLCQQLLYRRTQIAADMPPPGRGDLSDSNEALKRIDDRLKAEGCP